MQTTPPELHLKATSSSAISKRQYLRIFTIGLACIILLSVFTGILVKSRPSFLLQQMDVKEYKDLTYIKPFTSLVGFNWKFCKESKTKSEKKTAVLALSLFNW